jgi:hypothetical protein
MIYYALINIEDVNNAVAMNAVGEWCGQKIK